MRNKRSGIPPLSEPVKTRPAIGKNLIAAMVAALFDDFLFQYNERADVEFL